ncbi:MAG: VWA domain-containing protein [Bacteroidota bacterium]
MKRNAAKTFVLVVLCALFSTVTGQSASGTLDLTLVIKDARGRGLANTEVEFIETRTRQRILAQTDGYGVVKQQFTSGRYWQFNVKDVRDYFFWQFEVPPGRKYTLSKSVTYNYERYERETRPTVDRTRLRLEEVPLKTRLNDPPSQTEGIIRLEIQRADKRPLGRFPVALTCYKLGKTFTAKTNPGGIAVFKVPLGQEYEVDLDGINSFTYCDLIDKPYYVARKRFTYEPTEIVEKEVNDTIVQKLKPGQKGTSGRVITTITMVGNGKDVWREEPVFIEVIGQHKWYKGVTNQRGQVSFLLPKSDRYMIHGRYEPDLDVLDYRRRRGIGYGNKRILYRPMAKYQFPAEYIPTPEDLILEAFQEFMDQKYPAPEDGAPVRTHAEFTGPVNANSREAVLRLAFAPPSEVSNEFSPPLNLCFVIDKSGSMAGDDRIEQLKLSMEAFLNRLRPGDIASLVIFEDFETVVIPARTLGDRKRFKEAIVRLDAGGGTNIFKGMMAGYQEVMKNFQRGRTNRLILLSDGYGVTPVDEILAGQKTFTDQGVECSTVGVGENYNFALLKQLASNGGGHISHVGEAKEMRSAFMNELASVLFPVATDVTVEITYNRHLKYKQLYGYPLKERKGRKLVMKLRNLYAGLDQLAFVRFSLPQPVPEIEAEPVEVRLRCKDLRTGQMIDQVTEVSLEWSESGEDLALVLDQQEKKLYTIAVLNQSLKLMSDRFHGGDPAGARQAIDEGLASLQKAYPGPMDRDLAELHRKLLDYLDVLEKQQGR